MWTEVGRMRRMRRMQQTGMRTNMWWMKTKRWRGRVYVWVKKPKEQVKPNIEGMRGIEGDKSRQGGKLGNSVANETAGTAWNTKDLEPGKSSNPI